MASTLTHSSPRSSRAWLGISLEPGLAFEASHATPGLGLGQGLDSRVVVLDVIAVDWEEPVEKLDVVVIYWHSRTKVSMLTRSSHGSSRAWWAYLWKPDWALRKARKGWVFMAKGRVVVAAFLGTRSICESCWTCECRHVMHVGVRSLIYL